MAKPRRLPPRRSLAVGFSDHSGVTACEVTPRLWRADRRGSPPGCGDERAEVGLGGIRRRRRTGDSPSDQGIKTTPRITTEGADNRRRSREFHHVWGHFGLRVMKFGASAPASNSENPSACWGSRSGARGTRTPDLLGAIQACASLEFGSFAGVSRRSRLGLWPAFSASLRRFRLGAGQKTALWPD